VPNVFGVDDTVVELDGPEDRGDFAARSSIVRAGVVARAFTTAMASSVVADYRSQAS
jgi:hypothetical protein